MNKPRRVTVALLLTSQLLFTPALTSPALAGEPPKSVSRPAPAAAAVKTLTIKSSAFKNNGDIPTKYAYTEVSGGKNTSIPLSWSKGPTGTKSYAVLMYDTYADANEFVHWLVVNIPAKTVSLSEGASKKSSKMPKGSSEGINGFDESGYGGPNPPATGVSHTYKMVVYALNTESIDVPTEYITRADLEGQIQDQIVAKGELKGKLKVRTSAS